jgi:hypothetical protein
MPLKINKFLFTLLFLFSNCASLTNSQIDEIHAYATLLQNYSDYPSHVLEEYIDLKYDVDLCNSGTFGPSSVNDKIWQVYVDKKAALTKAKRLDVSIRVIKAYATAISNLSSNELSDNLDKPSQKLGENTDSLVSTYNSLATNKLPRGIGLLLGDAVLFSGKTIVKDKQAKELMKFILQGDTLISIITEAINKDLNEIVLQSWMPGIKATLASNHQNLLENLNPKGDYTAYVATQYNKEVGQYIVRIDKLEEMTKKTIRSVSQVQKAHKKLLATIQTRKKLKEHITDIQTLSNSLQTMHDDLTKILEAKTTK